MMSTPGNVTDNMEFGRGEEEGQEVSTGTLPRSVEVREAVREAYERFRDMRDGENAQFYPALAEVDPDLFGIAVVSTSGDIHAIGDVDTPFTIMSIAKPFVLALVYEELGADAVRRQVGVNATGQAFNSGVPVEQTPGHLTNPMVNSGALATTSLVPGATVDDRWESIVAILSRFAGRRLEVDETIYASASRSNHRNRSLANLLYAYGRIYGDIDETVDLYTRQSSLSITTIDLGVMGSTLADGGVNPITGDQVVSRSCCRHVLAVMATAGLYETSGDWLFDIGLPGKSGVGGGIVTVSPGKGSLATFSPPLDRAGNSVRGQLVASHLSYRLGLDVFVSKPYAAHVQGGS
jgi:glutaminase